MSLYKHVANKEEILDGIVELVVGEIAIPSEGTDWKEAMRLRAESARGVLSRHSWAIGLLEARGSTGPAVLRYVNAILGNLRSAGFSIENAAHAFWVLDSYVYGHVIQENSMPISTSEETNDSKDFILGQSTINDYPHLTEIGKHAMTPNSPSTASSHSASISSSTPWNRLRHRVDERRRAGQIGRVLRRPRPEFSRSR